MHIEEMIAMVRAFHTKFGQNYDGPPRELPASVAALRKKLNLEETTEFVVAVDRGELDEQLDAVVDKLYVTLGDAIQLGMADILVEAFTRVHHANMQKTTATSRHESKRDSVLDIVKPPGWKKPNLTDLITPEDV